MDPKKCESGVINLQIAPKRNEIGTLELELECKKTENGAPPSKETRHVIMIEPTDAVRYLGGRLLELFIAF